MVKNPEKLLMEALESDIKLARYMHYRDFLSHLYLHMKARLKPYSYIEFANQLGFGPSNNILRLVIGGKRPLSRQAAKRISTSLGLRGPQQKYWDALVAFNNARRVGEREESFKLLMQLKPKLLPDTIDESRLEYFTEWFHPVIREMAAREDFQMDAHWIQEKINFPLRLEQIKKSLELLTRLGLIYYDAKANKYSRSDETLDTGPDAKGIAFIRYHQKMIDLGRQSITAVKKEQREICGATLSLSEEKITELKQKINELLEESLRMESSDEHLGEKVIQLNMQMFPFTKN